MTVVIVVVINRVGTRGGVASGVHIWAVEEYRWRGGVDWDRGRHLRHSYPQNSSCRRGHGVCSGSGLIDGTAHGRGGAMG